ncbi:hypothetical protein [Terracidiphilus gabretensis]|uniref:hypothetical protein n=1 Tax=Terracidiphilus gabretensis TaxID=1577687 RepID=UPI00071B0B18|nr:hypothetical protein [Terracidiphilus gabretensis]
MNLDLRIPMGLMFSFVGIILAAFGLATRSTPALYEKSLGINVNLWWGIVLLIFGQIMFHMGRRTSKQLQKLPPTSLDSNPRRNH